MGRPRKWQANPLLQNFVQNARQAENTSHWLDLQDPSRYRWKKIIGQSPETNSRVAYYRHQGIVEGLFDCDGSLSCGRADLTQNHIYEVRTSLSDEQLRQRIILAWTLMRARHILLASQSMFLDEIVSRAPNRRWTEKCFLYRCPRSIEEALEETKAQIKFVGDTYSDLDARDFFLHAINTNRSIDPRIALSGIFVLPLKRTSADVVCLHFILIFAHQITDGLTAYRWTADFGGILNMPELGITTTLASLFQDPEAKVPIRLPPSQESLYPARSLSIPRRRWHWLLTRILRHVRIPPPPCFQNPLRRAVARQNAIPPRPRYEKALDYSVTPPLNSGQITAYIRGNQFHTLRALCKAAKVSVGSGLFTLVGMVMMKIEESARQHIPLASRLPFIGSFPVNPRPFFTENTTGKEDSCMLAFSDGVTLPFLPSDLDFAGRFKLLGRLAHKQLRQYQKRPRSVSEEVHLGSRSPSQLIPALYCATLERLDSRYPEYQKAGITVQGAYPASVSGGLATCGVSSVGDVSAIFAPPTNLDPKEIERVEEKDMVAEFKSINGCVRPRDGEFLVGAVGDAHKEEVMFDVSYDANAMDEEMVQKWKHLIESSLDNVEVGDSGGARARL